MQVAVGGEQIGSHLEARIEGRDMQTWGRFFDGTGEALACRIVPFVPGLHVDSIPSSGRARGATRSIWVMPRRQSIQVPAGMPHQFLKAPGDDHHVQGDVDRDDHDRETDGFRHPPGWDRLPPDMAPAMGGAYAAGRASSALRQIMTGLPAGRGAEPQASGASGRVCVSRRKA